MSGSWAPLSPTREQAAGLARTELADPSYDRAEPSPLQRFSEWLSDLLDRAFGAVPDTSAGRWIALAVLLIVVTAIVLVIRRWTGRIARSGRVRTSALLGDSQETAAEHRARAVAAAERGDLDEAVRERMRAIVCELEERFVLSPRPGRTADEAAGDAGRALPALGAGLGAGAAIFDEVAYGGRAASPADVDRLRDLDSQVSAAAQRPMTLGAVP